MSQEPIAEYTLIVEAGEIIENGYTEEENVGEEVVIPGAMEREVQAGVSNLDICYSFHLLIN